VKIDPGSLTVLIAVWTVSLLAGVAFIREALKDFAPRQGSKWVLVLKEIRYRLRMTAGIVLLLWVIGGIAWLVFKP
jgi:hypothetical protein